MTEQSGQYLKESALRYAATAASTELRELWLARFVELGGSLETAQRVREGASGGNSSP